MSSLPDGWKEYPLTELYDVRSGLSKHHSDFGFGYGFLSFKDVFYNYFVPNKLSELVNSTKKERELCSIKTGDVFLTRTSETMDELGMSCIALKDYECATFNGFTKRLRPKTNIEIIPEYAGYFFRSPKFRNEVTAMSSLCTRASLNNEMLGRLKIILPSIEEQSAIGHILKSLDDKIELNQQMNQTLEAIAKAIFKSWFVDFDPVRAKMEGRQPVGMDAATAELFPDSFEESSLGMIPKGWRVVQLPEVIEVNPTRSLSKGQIAPYLDMKNMPTQGHRPDNWIDRPFGSGTKFINGDTLIARITPCLENGKTAFVDFLENGQVGWGSTEYIIFRPKPPLPLEFAYYLARSEDLKVFAIQNMTGSSGRQRTPSDCFWNYLIALPSREVAIEFEKIVRSLMTKITSNSKQSRTLSITRDILLPKLMSGEIRVKEAEKLLDAVV